MRRLRVGRYVVRRLCGGLLAGPLGCDCRKKARQAENTTGLGWVNRRSKVTDYTQRCFRWRTA